MYSPSLAKRHHSQRSLILLVLGIAVAAATISAAVKAASSYSQAASKDTDQWQRVDLPLEQVPAGPTSQIRLAITTRDQRISGLIRIPGGIASNFDTGDGTAIVDLINVGSKSTGYADIRAVEIRFTKVTAGQIFTVMVIGSEAE